MNRAMLDCNEALRQLHAPLDSHYGIMPDARSLDADAGVTDSADHQPAQPEGSPDQDGTPSSEAMRARWYVAQHSPYEGPRLAAAIQAIGFRSFYPRQVVQKPRRDDVLRPLIPGYMFVQFSPDRPGWGRIARLQGFVTFLASGNGRPIPTLDGRVEALLREADPRGIIHPAPHNPEMPDVIGRRYSVKVGQWAQFTGEAEEVTDGKVNLAFWLFGRKHVQGFPMTALEAV